jgi:hypothetical protein
VRHVVERRLQVGQRVQNVAQGFGAARKDLGLMSWSHFRQFGQIFGEKWPILEMFLKTNVMMMIMVVSWVESPFFNFSRTYFKIITSVL